MITALTTDGVAYEVGFRSNRPPGETGVQRVSRNCVWARRVGTPNWHRSYSNMHATITRIEQSTSAEVSLWLLRDD